MSKDPAFLFYTNDFLSGTQFFTDEQVGKYLRLLMAQHQHGHLTEKQVLFICKSYDNDIIEKFAKDEQGLFYNVKLEGLINERKAYSESRKNNRTGKKKPIKSVPLKPKKTSKSYVNHMEDEDKDVNTIEFNVFYNEYPLKKGKLDAERAWNRLTIIEKKQAFDVIPKLIECTEPQFYPHPSTYLNGKRWLDEYKPKKAKQVEPTSTFHIPDEYRAG